LRRHSVFLIILLLSIIININNIIINNNIIIIIININKNISNNNNNNNAEKKVWFRSWFVIGRTRNTIWFIYPVGQTGAYVTEETAFEAVLPRCASVDCMQRNSLMHTQLKDTLGNHAICKRNCCKSAFSMCGRKRGEKS
jgi:hypothetical protein